MPELDGQVLAIRGAACGLGPSLAKRLAADGAILTFAMRTKSPDEEFRTFTPAEAITFTPSGAAQGMDGKGLPPHPWR